MKPFFIFALATFFFSSLHSQQPENTIWLNAAVSNHPADFVINPHGSSKIPFFNINIGVNERINKSHWYYDFEASLKYTQVFVHNYNNGSKIDLAFWGAKSGFTYSLEMPGTSSRILASAGPLFYLPIGGEYPDENPPYPPMKVFNDPADGLFYGGYLKGTFLFDFSKEETNPWSLGITMEFNTLWSHKKHTLNHLISGGLEIRYVIF